MDKREAKKLAEQVVDYLFSNAFGPTPVNRLVQETGDHPLKGPGWSRDAIVDVIEDAIAGRLPAPKKA